MATLFKCCLILFTVLDLSITSALIINDKLHTFARNHDYRNNNYNCEDVAELKLVCQTCFNEVFTCKMAVCCQDLILITFCKKCSRKYSVDSHNSAITGSLREASREHNDETCNCKQEKESKLLKNTTNPKRSTHSVGDHIRSKSTSLGQKPQKDLKLYKKWYSPYKYILSLFPQRIGYGHSLFLQGIRAQKSKNNNLDKVDIAWMKKSGKRNEVLGESPLHSTKGIKQVEIKKLAKHKGTFNIGQRSEEYSHSDDQSKSTIFLTRLQNKAKEVTKDLSVVTQLPVQKYKVSYASQTPTQPSENKIKSIKTKRNLISESELVMNKGSLMAPPLMEILAKIYNTPNDSLTAGTGDIERANYFFIKLLQFVDAFKQSAREHFQRIQQMGNH